MTTTKKPADLGGPHVQLLRALWRIEGASLSASKRREQKTGLTALQHTILGIVGRAGEIIAGDLAEAVCLHPSTLSGVTGRMVERKLLLRRTDPTDKRRVLLRLTAQGQRLRGGRSTEEAAVRRALRAATEEETRATLSLLGRVHDELRAEGASC